MNIQANPTVLTRAVDLDFTPDQVFEHLHRLPGFFFLDSGKADHELSQYSFIGAQPFLTIRSRGEGIDIVEGKTIRHVRGNPLHVLAYEMGQRRLTGGSPLLPFAGGGVGYFSYELGRLTAEVPLKAADDLGLPEMQVSFYKTLLAYEHRTRRWIGAAVDLAGGRGTTVRKRLGNDIEKFRELASKPHRGTVTAATTPAEPEAGEDSGQATETTAPVPGRRFTVDGVEVTSTMSHEEYLSAVRKIQEHIAAGEIYQANLTQRWTAPYVGEPGRLYHELRKASPVPFGFYMNTGECIIAGASPESFLTVKGRTVETRPIKGTRRRGASPEEDQELRRELESSEKDKAELTMIADLERNDLGRICATGSVEVKELHRLESFSTVHHLVSTVKGELRPGVTLTDIMEATFPSGSITGAPKKRAMEILDEVEGTVRGPYTGAMGFLGLDGSLSLNVAIRTLVLSQGLCHLGVGGGIVADSQPEAEYEECQTKARGMLAALREASAETPVAS
jgi:para-aminobenzoate synthetase component 1